ncbi:MAG: hypothetical protein HYX76_13765, partial [Acidobacteria bacterium]|nr:hypothetical protein [Acidobacteriota bacterium]
GTGRVRLGLLARNLREARFKAPENGQIRLQRQVRVGVAVLPDPDFTVALDFDLATADEVTGRRRNVAIGAEKWWSNRRFGGRAGLRASAVGDGRPVVAGGLSVGIRPRLFLEGQITRGRADADRGWGLSLSSKF